MALCVNFDGTAQTTVPKPPVSKPPAAVVAKPEFPSPTTILKGYEQVISSMDKKASLLTLIAEFDDPDIPYHALPRSGVVPNWNDYAHLERIQEWSGGETGEET
mgnify:CR=1 FL=1